jgi:hypothetical protein
MTMSNINVSFPRTLQMPAHRINYLVHTIPRVGEYITTDGTDRWQVDVVVHTVADPVQDARVLVRGVSAVDAGV